MREYWSYRIQHVTVCQSEGQGYNATKFSRYCVRVCLDVCVGVLLVVSVGVALGVFVGGVLLVAAARYFKRFKNENKLFSTFPEFTAVHPTSYEQPRCRIIACRPASHACWSGLACRAEIKLYWTYNAWVYTSLSPTEQHVAAYSDRLQLTLSSPMVPNG